MSGRTLRIDREVHVGSASGGRLHTRRDISKSTSRLMPRWTRFDRRRTRETSGSVDVLRNSQVSVTMPAGSSHREDVARMAGEASQPFPVASISKLLDEKRSLRGTVYFGNAGQQIDMILRNYPGMRWWMSKDGLVIDVVSDDAGQLSEFDRKAGKLVCDGMQDGKLSKAAVNKIATELDDAGFSLLDNLQPAQRKQVAAFNQKYGRSAVKTFVAAATHPQFSRAVRRRLYVARNRYRSAHRVRSDACPPCSAGQFSEDF